jgi:hypothetical protein
MDSAGPKDLEFMSQRERQKVDWGRRGGMVCGNSLYQAVSQVNLSASGNALYPIEFAFSFDRNSRPNRREAFFQAEGEGS